MFAFNLLLFASLLFCIYITKYQKYIYLIILSLSDLTFVSDHEGIDNHLSCWSRGFICLCRCEGLVRGLLLDRYLGSQKLRENTYTTLLHHPFLFNSKPTRCSRGSKKDFWRRCRGGSRKTSQDLTPDNESFVAPLQVKTYQVPITNPYLPHYVICHLPLVFLSPTSPLLFYSPSLSILPLFLYSPLFRLLLVCSCVGLLACHDGSR